ncbi:hypothetical protein [Streptomyces narbonensis]
MAQPVGGGEGGGPGEARIGEVAGECGRGRRPVLGEQGVEPPGGLVAAAGRRRACQP